MDAVTIFLKDGELALQKGIFPLQICGKVCHKVCHNVCDKVCATKCVRQSVCDKVCAAKCATKCAARCATKCATRCVEYTPTYKGKGCSIYNRQSVRQRGHLHTKARALHALASSKLSSE